MLCLLPTLSDNPWCWKQDVNAMLVLFCHEFHQHMQIRQNQENDQTQRIRENAGFALAEKALPVWTRCKTSRRWADQVPSLSHTASHVAQTSWRPAEDMGKKVEFDLEPHSGKWVFGHARWRKDCVKVSSEFAQNRRAWSAVKLIGDAGSTRPGWMPTQALVQVSTWWVLTTPRTCVNVQRTEEIRSLPVMLFSTWNSAFDYLLFPHA